METYISDISHPKLLGMPNRNMKLLIPVVQDDHFAGTTLKEFSKKNAAFGFYSDQKSNVYMIFRAIWNCSDKENNISDGSKQLKNLGEHSSQNLRLRSNGNIIIQTSFTRGLDI